MDDAQYVSLPRFIEHWDGVRYVSVQLLRSFDEQDLDYRLLPEWRSVGELFHHIGAQQYFVARGVCLGRWEPEQGEPDLNWRSHRESVLSSLSTVEEWLLESQSKLRTWVNDVGVEQLTSVRDDNPWHEGIRGWLLLHHAYQDELHHRGQLYAVARLLGRTPPVVYAEEHPEYWNQVKGR